MNKLKLYSIMALMASLTACSAYDDLVGNDDAAVGSIAVLAQSGSTVDVSGEWLGECKSTFPDSRTVVVVSGTTISLYTDTYATTGGTCVEPANTREKVFEYQNSAGEAGNPSTVTGEKTVSGWVDSFGSGTTAPNSLAGPALADTPKVTTIDMPSAWSTLVGDYRLIVFVDDSDAANGNIRWYMAEVENTTGTYPNYLATAPYYTKKK